MRKSIWAAAAALAVAACGSSGPVREPAELVDIESPEFRPTVRWNTSPGDGGGDQPTGLRLAVEDDLIVTADTAGDVFALRLEDGKQLWNAETDARVVSGPSVSGDLVLLGTLDAEVIALKRADGSPAWRAKVSSEVLAAPVGSGNVVVARGGDGKVFGLSADSGVRIWSFDRSVPSLTLRGMSSPLIYGNTVYVGLDNGRVAALNLADGQLLWEQVVAVPTGRTELERIVDVDANLLVTRDGVYAVSFGGELAAVSVDDGRVAWRRPVRSYSGIALSDSLVIVTDEEGVIWALDSQSGAAAWTQDALKYRRLSPPAAMHGHIVVADLDGYLHWLSPRDGTIVARVRAVRDPVTASLVTHDGTLYVLDTSGRIAAVTIP